jgi:hypothetical protein
MWYCLFKCFHVLCLWILFFSCLCISFDLNVLCHAHLLNDFNSRLCVFLLQFDFSFDFRKNAARIRQCFERFGPKERKKEQVDKNSNEKTVKTDSNKKIEFSLIVLLFCMECLPEVVFILQFRSYHFIILTFLRTFKRPCSNSNFV